jgi:signal transduction histidine kinase
VCLAVHDTGRGIAPGDLPRLFDPFDRLGAEQTDVEGSGIGLAITRRLVEAMSGDIEVASVPGVGTTVSVRLPPVG